MRLPLIKNKNLYKRRMVAFGGLNLTDSFVEGELCDCSGISHECFPALSQRKKSELLFSCANPRAAFFGENECIATDDALYYNKKIVGALEAGQKTVLQTGKKIVVFPDKVYYDTETKRFAAMEGKCSLKDMQVTFSPAAISVEDNVFETESMREAAEYNKNARVFKYTDASVDKGEIRLSGATIAEAQQLKEGDIFSGTSGNMYYRIAVSVAMQEGDKVKIVSDRISVKNISKNIFDEFRVGDIVVINGSSTADNNREAKVKEIRGCTLVFEGDIFKAVTETADIIIKRKIPDFSCVCSYANRLWGCEGNTLYASKPGDPLNFFSYDNLSTDSFAVESNTPGSFTAITSYGTFCLIFKENSCYKLFGNRPANFQLIENYDTGIAPGNAASVVNLSGRLIYKGNGGIYASYGASPTCISQRLGSMTMKNCAAGGMRNLYYISADTENGREEFVYDSERDLWSKSGVKEVNGYAVFGEVICRLMPWGVEKITDEADSNAEWFAEFCPFDEDYHKTKSYIKLHITAELFENAYIRVEVKGDRGVWRTVMTRFGKNKEYINIPCAIKNCHEARLKISGKGKSKIESIVREFSVN